MNKSDKENKRTILQLIPAEGWGVTQLVPDGKTVSHSLLVCWALIEDSLKKRSVIGMIANKDNIQFCDESSDPDRPIRCWYIPPSQIKDVVRSDKLSKVLDGNILELVNSTRLINALTLNMGSGKPFVLVRDVITKPERELMIMPHFGKETVKELKGILGVLGLGLDMVIVDGIPKFKND